MKRVFTIIALVITLSSFAQKGVVTSAGENSTTNGKIVNWTIGSTVAGTSKTEKYRVYTGDIQPTYQVFYKQKSNKIELDCFPNPATDFFNLELHTNEFEGLVWKLYNAKGQTIRSDKLKSNKIEIYVNSLSAASYLLNIYDAEGQLVSGAKLIKK